VRLKKPTTIPPITPEIIPDINGAPDAIAIPKHSGVPPKHNQTRCEIRFKVSKRFIFFVIILI
jgi:hypothetical protein